MFAILNCVLHILEKTNTKEYVRSAYMTVLAT
jgi:hypothetical protein